MLWLFPWPESIKQRLCRYLLEHYLGQYFEQKIVLEQLNIDLYKGVVTLNNINLNCNALNEQLKQLNIPFEIINGSVGGIFVSVPWHDLINDNCKLEVKNINLTIRPTTEDYFSNCNSPTTSDMFSSMFLNSMQTSRLIAENCLKDDCGSDNDNTVDLDENFSTTSLIGLDALTRTIDSVLARIKINAENIHIRLEHLIERNQNGYSNGIALEFHIKSIKYFDIDTSTVNKNKPTSDNKQQPLNEKINLPSITNKKFAIDGLTVYCDEFTVKENSIFHEDTPPPLATSNLMTTSIYVNEDDNFDNLRTDGQTNVNYVYTNPILCATFSGIQEIDITIKQPSISSLQVPSQQYQPQQNAPKLEVNAQFGSIKCLLCPKQIHLLYELVCAFANNNNHVDGATGGALNDADFLATNNSEENTCGAHKQKPIRGCDQQKFESLIQNDLLNQCSGGINNRNDLGNLDHISLDDASGCDITLDGEEDDDTEFQSFNESQSRQSKNLSENQSDIYYSMLPPADNEINLNSMIFDSNRRKLNINEENESLSGEYASRARMNSESCDEFEDEEDQDEAEFKALNNKKEKIAEQIKHASSNQTQFELFVYKIKFTMFSLTILQENPANSHNKMLGDYMKNDSESYFEHVASINTSGILNSKDFLDIRKQFFEACACSDHLLLLCKPINIHFTQKLDKSYLTITDLSCSVGHMELIEYLTNTNVKLTPTVASTSTSKNFKSNLIKSAVINEIIKFDATSTPTTPHEACLKMKLLLYEPTINLLNINSSDKRKIFPKVPFKHITVNLNRLILDVDISIMDRLYHLLNPLLDSSSADAGAYQSEKRSAAAFLDEDDEYYANKRVKLKTISNFLNSFDFKIPNLKLVLRFPIAQIITSNTNLSTIDWRKRSIREQYLMLQLSEFNFQLNFYLNDFNKLLLFSCNQINAFYSSQKLTDKPIQFIQANADEANGAIKFMVRINDTLNPNYMQNIEKAMSELFMADENDLNYDSLMSKFSINIGGANANGGATYSPFSSANSHISGKDNHRIINPANKYEMNKFITHTKLNSEVVINLKLPRINLLICDFEFLNDLYNCFLNDLLMWEPLAPKVLNNLIHINTTSYYTAGEAMKREHSDKFELCKSAILKTNTDDDEGDYKGFQSSTENNLQTLTFNDNLSEHNNSLKLANYQPHKLCFILNAKSVKLKCYFNSPLELQQEKAQINCGEFDLNLNSFKLCVLSGHYGDINNQYVSLLTDKISLAHDNRTLDFNSRKQFLYPTTQTSFEVLFNSVVKQKELIGSNKVATCLFDPQATTNGEIKLNNYRKIKFKIPMVSLALESKLEPNADAAQPAKKHIKLALNINNACLNHLFCTEDKFWLLQLIELLNLEDISINGYIVPIVVTELHLNVTNSSIDYRPLKLDTKALIAFKSLRISSNVAQNSQATLLIFNVEDIYLFLTNYKQEHYDLRRDYVCIANADIFEFRLLINDKPTSSTHQQQQVDKKLKSPILDIKIRCNLIQIRTCVDSMFCLFELLSYIGTDGDIIVQAPQVGVINVQDATYASFPVSLQEEQLHEQEQQLLNESPTIAVTEPLSIPAPLLNNSNESHICDMVEEAMSQSVYGALDHENDARFDSPCSTSRRNSDDYGSPFGPQKTKANEEHSDAEDDKSLIDDFEFIDMIPGLGVLPQNGEEFVIKNLRKAEASSVMIDDNYFSKPMTKIDVLKAPDTYPCPINSFSVQEISVHWSLYGGHDMFHERNEEEPRLPPSPAPVTLSTTPKKNKSSEAIEINPMKKTISFSSSTSSSPMKPTSLDKQLPKLAGGRIATKYDTRSLNWIHKGPATRNLDVCMDFMFNKVKTKIDIYDPTAKDYNFMYRIAFAIGDIEIIDKLSTSSFNKFLFRYESDTCPKHTNSNMIFLKLLCSRSNDKQRLIECDLKLSIQPLRFNIDSNAAFFLHDYFICLSSKQIKFNNNNSNVPTATSESNEAKPEEDASTELPATKEPQQIFIRNFIFSPDLCIHLDFSGKFDKRHDNKLDTLTNILLIMIQLSNTEIKLKRVCYKRGFLGIEKLLTCLINDWVSDIKKNQRINLIKGLGLFNSLIQFFEGFTYLFWYPIDQYRKDGRVLFGIKKGSAAFSTSTILATIELTNRMFQLTKNIAEFFYDLVTPHQMQITAGGGAMVAANGNVLKLTKNRNIRQRRHPSDIREGLTNAYYVLYEGINDTTANLVNEITNGSEHNGIRGAFGGALRQLPSAAFAPIVLAAEASTNILSGLRNQLKPDEKRDDEQKYKSVV